MEKIKKIAVGFDVLAMQLALSVNPQLWNVDGMRTVNTSPHREIDDIWARYAADASQAGPHESVWYPAADVLPVRDLVFQLMYMVKGERLGGVLITRIPAGKQVYPHIDRPAWHAEYYDKFAIQIASAPGQKFCFDGEELETEPGDVFWFDNGFSHWVTNDTPHDRVTMICCIKTDKGN